jgi:hypothetical protein
MSREYFDAVPPSWPTLATSRIVLAADEADELVTQALRGSHQRRRDSAGMCESA